VRTSLVSATSLLALLLADEGLAYATPSLTIPDTTVQIGSLNGGQTYQLVGTTGTASETITVTNGFGGSGENVWKSTFTAAEMSDPLGEFAGSPTKSTVSNSGSSSITETFTFTPTITGLASSVVNVVDKASSSHGGSSPTSSITLSGVGVAPIGALSSSSTNYFLVNGSGTGQTATITATNSGNGNLSGAGTVSNFRGTLSAGAASSVTGFANTAQTISIGDSSTKTYNYTFAPTKQGQTVSQLIVATLSNGSSNGQNLGTTQTVTLTGTGVAPVQSITNASTNLIRVGTTATSTITVSNIGNGNRATGSTSNVASNLNGSISTTNLASGVTGPGVGTSFSLPDASSTTLAYTYAPTSRSGGTVSSTINLAFSNGNTNGSNTAQTQSSVFVNQAVGPVYQSSVTGGPTAPGSGVTGTGTPTPTQHGSVGPAGQTINFGTLSYNQSETVYLTLKNTTSDPGGALTNLTIENYSIAGTGAYEFHPSLLAGSVISENGGLLILPITLIATGGGALNSSLTIFTDESAALGGAGDTFTYTLTAFAVPEPATMAVLGAGLAGLASIRRRRKQAAAQ
jgi:hypothetical protein